MTRTTQSSVELLQELISVLSTRKEAGEKILSDHRETDVQQRLPIILAKNDRYIGELVDELSQYGDGISGEAGIKNAYKLFWSETLKKDDHAGAEQFSTAFFQMEKLLKKYYQDLSAKSGLPKTLSELVKKQAAGLLLLNEES